MSYVKMLPLTLCSAVLWASGCGDDAANTSDGGTDSSSTSAGSTAAPPTTTTLTDGTTTTAPMTTSTAAGSSSGSADSTGGASSGSDGTGSGSDSGSGSGSGSESTGDTSTNTGGQSGVCEEGGELVLNWGIEIIGGQFPDDLPTDLVADCTLGPPLVPAQLRVNCPDLQMYVNIDATPAPELPEQGEALELRFHRAPGPLGFPDLWLQMDFASGMDLTLAASSVLDPGTPTLELPWDMSVSDEDCGPFTLEDPFGNPDTCGDQMWLGLALDVMGQSFTAFHGSYAQLASPAATVDFWVGSARDYGTLPEFCDFAAQFFTTMTLSVPED